MPKGDYHGVRRVFGPDASVRGGGLVHPVVVAFCHVRRTGDHAQCHGAADPRRPRGRAVRQEGNGTQSDIDVWRCRHRFERHASAVDLRVVGGNEEHLAGFMGKLMNLQCGTSVINASEPGGGLTNIFLGPWRRGRDLEVDEFRGPCLMLDVNAMAPKRGIAATAVFFGASGPAWMGLYRAWGIMWGMGMSLAGVNVSATIFASAIMAVNSSWRLSVEPESPQRESAPVTSFGRPSR